MTIAPLTGRRAGAYGLDALGYLGIAAAMLPLGLVLLRVAPPSPEQTIWISAIPPVLAAVWAARAESSPGRATWGKRRRRIVVDRTGGRLSGPRALVRNLVKIAVPWQIGHVVAIGAASGGFETGNPWTLAATIAVYPLVGVLVASVAFGSGRGLHDRIAGSTVRQAEPTS